MWPWAEGLDGVNALPKPHPQPGSPCVVLGGQDPDLWPWAEGRGGVNGLLKPRPQPGPPSVALGRGAWQHDRSGEALFLQESSCYGLLVLLINITKTLEN